MTSQDFRSLALSFSETEEHAHMDHPDFRVAGKIFATLGYPEDGWAMVKTHAHRTGDVPQSPAGRLQPLHRRLGTPRRHQRAPESRQKAYLAPCSRSRLAPRRSHAAPPKIRFRPVTLRSNLTLIPR